MMACEAIDMAVAGEDLQMMAMAASPAADGDCDGSDGSFIFASVELAAADDRSAAPQWSRDDCHGANGDAADASYLTHMVSEDRSRLSRHPRWTRGETLVLAEGKRLEEARRSKAKESRERGIEVGRANSDSRWLSISQFCDRMGVSRSPAQCRKRWCNLSADYKRVRDWEVAAPPPHGRQSFWLMSSDLRKENKLPGCFDREVFNALNKFLGVHACAAPDMIFDSGRQGGDGGLFSDIEHPLVEENLSVSADKEIDSPAKESLSSAPGHYEEKFLNEHFNVDGCEEIFEDEPDILPGGRKRKRPAIEEGDEFNRELCNLLESSSKILTAHMDSQNLNFHLDRAQRKEHVQSLVLVLGKLTEAVGKIADKL